MRRYGVDPGKVVVLGGLSGAHISLLAAYAPDEPRLKPAELAGTDTSVMAVVSYYGFRRCGPPSTAGCAGRLTRRKPPHERPEPGPVADRIQPADVRAIAHRGAVAAGRAGAPTGPEPARRVARGVLRRWPNWPRRSATSVRVPAVAHVPGHTRRCVPLDAARRLHRALEAANVPVVRRIPWTEHAFDLIVPPLATPPRRRRSTMSSASSRASQKGATPRRRWLGLW